MAERASIESQLGSAPCEVGDDENIFLLRESDDYQSRLLLGNALCSQYRFREAIEAYRSAELIRGDDPALYIRLGGAYLTVRKFDRAEAAYRRALSLGVPESGVGYQRGFRLYLLGDFEEAEKQFRKCLPCGGELEIAVIYWRCLCRMRLTGAPQQPEGFRQDMEVGHHTAYKRAAELFAGMRSPEETLSGLEAERGGLDYVIPAYGLCRLMVCSGEAGKGRELLEKVLLRREVWPSLPYLAAWNDKNG